MSYAVMVGSNMFIGTNGILNVNISGKSKEFFRIRQIHRVRSEGTYLAVDCDIKDADNKREVKICKNKPVAADDNIIITNTPSSVTIQREDKSVIIKIEQLSISDPTLPQVGPIPVQLKANPVDAIVRITGDFYAGNHQLHADNSLFKVGGIQLSNNLMVGTGGMKLTQMGFAM